MRSFIAFLACTGFIVWAHSCEKRIVGVKVYAHRPNENNGLSFNSSLNEYPMLWAYANTPVALDALFVNIRYTPGPEPDWKR